MPAAALMLVILVIAVVGGIYWLVNKSKGEDPAGEVHIPPPTDEGGAPRA